MLFSGFIYSLFWLIVTVEAKRLAFAALAYRQVFGSRAAYRFTFGDLAVAEVSTASLIQIAATSVSLVKLSLAVSTVRASATS